MAHRPLQLRAVTAAGLVAGVLAFCAGALPGPARSQALAPIIVTTNTATEALPFFYAQAHGLFARAGLDVKLDLASTGSGVELALVGGAANIGFTNTLTLTNAVAKGVPLDALAAGTDYDSAHPDVRTMASADSAIRTGKDLDGKIVGVPGLNDAAQIATMAWIDQQGGDAKSVQFVEVPPPTMYAALQAHRVDAVTIYDPFAGDFAAKGARTLGYPNNAIAAHFLVTAWIANASWLQTHRNIAERFEQVMHDASLYCTAHFEQLVPFVARYSKLPAASLEKIAPETYPGGINAALLQPVIDVAAKYEHLPDFVAAREIFSTPLNTASTSP